MKDENKAEQKALEVEQFLIEEFGNYLEYVGAKRLLGRIWGLLSIRTEPMSLKDISNRLQISKPAVSTTINAGLMSEIFQKVYVPEFPRESFYQMETDFMQQIIDPGVKKLTMLRDKFVKAKEKLDSYDGEKTEKLINIEKRVIYMVKALGLVLDEYHKFGESLKIRLDKLDKEIKNQGKKK